MSMIALETEAGLVECIVEGLRLSGYLCQRCNQHRADKSGSDVLPDLFIRRDAWPAGCWFGMEVKTATGRLGTARRGKAALSQQDLYDRGAIVVVRSVEEALAAVKLFEMRLERD